MTLTDVFTVSSCIKLALRGLTEIMLRQMVLVDRDVVNFGPAEVVMWITVRANSVLLCHHLIFVQL